MKILSSIVLLCSGLLLMPGAGERTMFTGCPGGQCAVPITGYGVGEPQLDYRTVVAPMQVAPMQVQAAPVQYQSQPVMQKVRVTKYRTEQKTVTRTRMVPEEYQETISVQVPYVEEVEQLVCQPCQPAPVVQYQAPQQVVQYQAPTYEAPRQVVQYQAPTYEAPQQMVQYAAPQVRYAQQQYYAPQAAMTYQQAPCTCSQYAPMGYSPTYQMPMQYAPMQQVGYQGQTHLMQQHGPGGTFASAVSSHHQTPMGLGAAGAMHDGDHDGITRGRRFRVRARRDDRLIRRALRKRIL